MKFTSSKDGSAANKALQHLKDNGYRVSRRHPTPDKRGGVYEHPTKPLVYVTHYSTGVSHIDESAEDAPKFSSIITEKLRTQLSNI